MVEKVQENSPVALRSLALPPAAVRRHGPGARDIKTFDDIRLVPKVEKAMMRDVQREEPFPYGGALCLPLEKVPEFHYAPVMGSTNLRVLLCNISPCEDQ